MSDNPPLPSGQQEQLTSNQAQRLAHAFQAIFGQPSRNGRSSDQRLVLAHLRKIAHADGPVFIADAGGRYDALAAAHRDGARAVVLIIERQLERARKMAEVEKPKPQSRR